MLQVSDSVTPQTAAHQAPLSTEFSRQEYCGLPFPPPGDHPDPGMEPTSAFSCIAGRFFTAEPLGKLQLILVDPPKEFLPTLKLHTHSL